MAEWLYEEGIGENRAILVEGGDERVAMSPGHGCAVRGTAYPLIIEAAIELPGSLRAGAVVPGRLSKILIPGRRGIALLEGGSEALLEPLPADLAEGASFRAEILREPIPEPGRPKLAKVRATDAEPRPGPGLADRLGAFMRHGPHDPDRFEEAGWSEMLDEAMRGEIAFAGGSLRMSLTPAMTLFDVDGGLAPAELARAGAAAAARAIRRFGIGGSIGIDLPTLPGRADRQAAAAAVDAVLPPPFERTAVNGFGFLQIVRRRERAAIPEILQGDPVGAAARALLRRAQRYVGRLTLRAAPAVAARLEANPGWIETLRRQVGGDVALRADPALSISAAHVERSLS